MTNLVYISKDFDLCFHNICVLDAFRFVEETNIDNPNVYDIFNIYIAIKYLKQTDDTTEWFAEKLRTIDQKLKLFKRFLNEYIKQLNNEKIINACEMLCNIDCYCSLDFFEFLYDRCIDSITEEVFDYFLTKVNIYYLIDYPKVARKYLDKIKKIILQDIYAFPHIVDHYDYNKKDSFCFPTFNEQEIDMLVDSCLSAKVNSHEINILSFCLNHKNKKETYFLSDKSRLKINALVKDYTDKVYSNRAPDYSTLIEFADVDEDKFDQNEMNQLHYIFSNNKYFPNGCTKETLYKFLGINGLINYNGLISNIFNKFRLSKAEQIFTSRPKNFFGCEDFYFKENQKLSIINAFYFYSLNQGVNLEKLVSIMLKEDFPILFKVDNFTYTYEETTNFYTKCGTLAYEIEALLKQYVCLQSTGSIDGAALGLLTISSFKDVTSLNKFRYIEKNTEDNKLLDNILFIIFNENSPLISLAYKYKLNSFYECLEADLINYDELKGTVKFYVDTLIKEEILKVKPNNYVTYFDYNVMQILNELYEFGAIKINRLKDSELPAIKKFIERKFITISDKLFTHDEAKYLNYYVNNQDWVNNLAIRNLYVHGGGTYLSDEQNKSNFIKLFMIYLTILEKIMIDLFESKYDKYDYKNFENNIK